MGPHSSQTQGIPKSEKTPKTNIWWMASERMESEEAVCFIFHFVHVNWASRRYKEEHENAEDADSHRQKIPTGLEGLRVTISRSWGEGDLAGLFWLWKKAPALQVVISWFDHDESALQQKGASTFWLTKSEKKLLQVGQIILVTNV